MRESKSRKEGAGDRVQTITSPNHLQFHTLKGAKLKMATKNITKRTSTQNLPFTVSPAPATKLDAANSLHALRGFISQPQLSAIDTACWGEERQFFYDKLVEVAGIVSTMPKSYETDDQGDKAIAYLHYFSAAADWYITEKDMEPEQHQAFGWADLGYGGEMGYISIVELVQNGVELDLYFNPRPLCEALADKACNNTFRHLYSKVSEANARECYGALLKGGN